MTTDLLVAAAALLALAVLVDALTLLRATGRWEILSGVARMAAIAALAVSLILAAASRGRWSPLDSGQMPVDLAFFTLAVYAALSRRFRVDGPGALVDLFTLGLVLAAVLAIPFDGLSPLCAQQARPSPLVWALLLVGGGAINVAGGAGLALIVSRVRARRTGSPSSSHRADPNLLLAQAARLSLVFLGGGLVLNAWSAWQVFGSLSGCDPRGPWLSLVWLVAGAGILARNLERHGGPWAGALAMTAAALATSGLLGVMDVRGLLGI